MDTAPTLADTLAVPPANPRRGERCSMRSLTESLDADTRAALAAALGTDRSTLNSAEIARRLTAGGHPVAQHVVNRHRNRECKCPDEVYQP